LPNPAPLVYLLRGEDELAIAQVIKEMEAHMGDPALASLNTTRLEGGSLSLDELRDVTAAMPILTKRRLVVVTNPRARLNTPALRDKFIKLLDGLTESTALVLIERSILPEEDWLLKWAKSDPQRVWIKDYSQPKGASMEQWIQDKAKSLGGQFTPQAAALLASLVGEDTRLAYQEIQKLLQYVDFAKPVMPEDVSNLIPYGGFVEDFALANAIRERNYRRAIGIVHQELNDKDPLIILQSIVTLYRRLLLARDVIDRGGGEADLVRELKITPGHARHLARQAPGFSIATLTSIYHKLLETDEAVKSGLMEGDVALDTFIASFTTQG
jgi:DNA polymerase-3 subunit delta